LSYERAYLHGQSDDRSTALADAPRLLKGPKLVLAHATFVTDVTPLSRMVCRKPTADGHNLYNDLVLEYARCYRVMGCNKPYHLTSLAVGSLLGSHFLVRYLAPSAILWKLALW
jgi:hypothetical protein